jgi:hypothetical protein
MTVLFLDIDGVLNSTRSCLAFGGFPHGITPDHLKRFDHCAVGLIRRLCKETGAVCVLSSTWRQLHPYTEISAALDIPMIGATPKSDDGFRGREIAAWLAAHPEVTQYAIVDDDGDMLPEQKPYFVQTPHSDGLRWDDYEHLKCLLAAKTSASADAARG